MTTQMLEHEVISEVDFKINCKEFACKNYFEVTNELKNNPNFEGFFQVKKINMASLVTTLVVNDDIWFSDLVSSYVGRTFDSLEELNSFISTLDMSTTFYQVEESELKVTFLIYRRHFFCPDHNYTCEDCSHTNYSYSVGLRGEILCDDCWGNSFYYCGNCEETTEQGDGDYIHFDDSNWCQNCIDNNLSWCDFCNEWEQDLCDRNFDSDDVERWNRQDYEGIYSYNFKPRTPDFFLGSADSDNQKLTFGFELEVEAEGARFSDGLKIIKDCLGDFVYMKGDGSLNSGYEIVTYPFSFNYYQEAIDFSFLGKLQELGYRSWTPETCGFHIHIARAGFESAGHIWKFANLILQNPRAWQKLAGRAGTRWASYDNSDNPVMKVLKGETEPMRYVAVNMTNAETIEVRIFRGSLNETRIRSAIESVYCAMEYTRKLSVHDINQGGLKFDRFVDWVFSYQQGLGFLAEGKNSFLAFESLLKKYELINRESIAEVEIQTKGDK